MKHSQRTRFGRRRFLGMVASMVTFVTLGGRVRLAGAAEASPESVLGWSRWRALRAMADRIFPRVDGVPSASEVGVPDYLARSLAAEYRDSIPMYEKTLDQLVQLAQTQHDCAFDALPAADQTALVKRLEEADPSGFETIRRHMIEGYFALPQHGGNRDSAGWKAIGFTTPHAHH